MLGAMSAAVAGRAICARAALMESINNRIWFAGEAAHETALGHRRRRLGIRRPRRRRGAARDRAAGAGAEAAAKPKQPKQLR